MSNIASLEAELSRQQSLNSELKAELAEISYGVSQGYDKLESCNSSIQQKLNDSAAKLEDSHRKVLGAIEMQAEIDKMYVRFKQMALANKKIRECNNKKYYEFANYRTVRKLVQAVMDNLDLNMVSDAVIYKSVETQHLKTPDYWLTCSLIAIMAWKNDDKALAERAIDMAVRLDKKNTAVFLMMFNLRMDRDDAALKWFFCYQECPLVGSDQRNFLLFFALMNKTVNSSESISDESRQEIRNFIAKVIQSNVESQGYSEDDMVAMAKKYYDRMDDREESAYPLLMKHCSSFSVLSRALMKAKGNIPILEFLKKTIHVDAVAKNAFIKNFIDELIAKENDTEKGVYDEIRYNELIIQYQGEVDLAKEEYERTKAHDESELNLIAEMIDWVFTGDPEEIDAQERLNMFTLTKDYQEKAIENHTNEYRKVDNVHLPIKINDYSTTADFSSTSNEEQKVRTFYEEKRDSSLAEIKNLAAYIAFAVAGVAAVASPFVSFALLILTVIAIGFGVVTLLGNKSARKDIEMKCMNDINAAIEVFHCLADERNKYLNELAEFDAYVEQIQNELAQV